MRKVDCPRFSHMVNASHKGNSNAQSGLSPFLSVDCPRFSPEGRWRKYTYEEILQREKTSLDIKWLKDDTVTPEDYTLGEVFDELEETRKSVTDAIANLKRMARGVRELGMRN